MKKRVLAAGMAALLAFSACACGKNGGTDKKKTGSTDDLSEHVTLTWVMAAEEPDGYPEVIEEVNKYLNEKINATLEMQFIQPGDYATKMNMMLASQADDWDLCFTSNWQNPYQDNARKGGYYELNELLETETPELYNFFEQRYWDALTMSDGGIYAIPNYQVMYEQYGLWFKKDLVEKYDLMDKVDSFDSYEDLDEIYSVIAENEPEMVVIPYFTADLFDLGGSIVTAGFNIDDGEVTDRLGEDKLEQFKMARKWYVDGILPNDPTFNETTYLKTGKVFSRFNRELPGAEAKLGLTYDWQAICRPTSQMLLRREECQSALTAINRMSKHPARALKLMELMTTDQYLFNLMAYGIEGVNYTKEGNRITPTENSYYMAEFRIGNQLLAYLMPGYEDGIWEETERMNQEAPVDEAIGFVFDESSVETEIANVNSAGEYGSILTKGVSDDVEGTFEKHKEKRKIAGAQTIKEEIERQYKEWKAQQ